MPKQTAPLRKTDKINKNKLPVVSSESVGEIRSNFPKGEPNVYNSTMPNSPLDSGEAPKIRRMTDSTRAREAESIKNGNRKRNRKESYTYQKESPEGEYIYTPPTIKKRKRSRESIIAEAENPENRKYITDIVPSPQAVEASRPVKPAPRAEKTSIDFTSKINYSPKELDVHITQDSEEYLSEKAKHRRTRRIVDFNYYGDVEDVGRDIYELKDIISVRATILALTSFISLYITVFNQFRLPVAGILSKENIVPYLAVHFILGLVSVISSFTVISKGIKKLFTLKADSDSLTSITALSCLIAIIPGFFSPQYVYAERIYMPVGILALFFNSLGKLLIMKRASRNFKLVSKNSDRYGIVYVRDEERAEKLTRGTVGDFPILATMRKTDFLTDFLRYTYSADVTDNYCKRSAPICMLISTAISLLLTVFCKGNLLTLDSLNFGFSIFSMLICACSCIAMPFAVNIPLERISNDSIKRNGIMLSYQSVDDFYDTNSILINADSLFPEYSVKLAGVKVFSNTKVDEALLEAASLTHHAGSIMRHIFDEVFIGKEDILYNIENFSYEESMGLCGWINNRRVLFGNRELMVSHNIEGVPTKLKEAEYKEPGQEAMYLSISGNLAAMFTVEIRADREIKKWAKRLCKNKIFIILKSIDPCITLKKLSSLFEIPEEMIRILPKRLHDDFEAETKKAVRLSASMACSGGFPVLAQLIIGTKRVHRSATAGLIAQTVSIVLGLCLCIILILSKAFEFNYVYMSATALVIYNLACTLFTYIAISLKKK